MVGSTIKRYRRIADLTQAELAHKAGISRVGLSDIERGLYNPSIDTLQAISKALNTSIDKIFQPVNQ